MRCPARSWILRRTIFVAAFLIVLPTAVRAPRAFAQLPDFLKPKNLPLDDARPQDASDGKASGKGSVPGQSGGRSIKRPNPAPRIIFAQAARNLTPGEIWDLYLVLEDEDKNLKTLEWELLQEGPGGSSRGAISLAFPRKAPKEGQERFENDEIGKLAGYLELDTGGPDVLRHPGRFDGLRMTLTVTAVDRNGLQSKKRIFPLTLRLGAPEPSRPVVSGVTFRHRFGSIIAVFPDPLAGK
ncbi:MAG: hypothetical protein QGF68_19645 [Nitrospinota bacterium]|jgi:hypothetical protein|nr:hypothetical protein [Nitrospinota bacterium]